jgi:hypothetical protein
MLKANRTEKEAKNLPTASPAKNRLPPQVAFNKMQ